jgi:predicted TIM-barrel fold metal-dependent hydrolase
MAQSLQGKKVAILAADMVERVELEEPRQALEQAGAQTELVSLKPGSIKAFDHFDPAKEITVDKAVEEVEWLIERGAKVILVRPAPVPGPYGRRSFALPEFDPFWELVQEKDLVVGMHASDSGYQRYINEWEGIRDEFQPFAGPSAFAAIVGHSGRAIIDTVASAIGHGLCTRFPKLKIAPVENGSNWVPPLLHDMAFAYDANPHIFEEDPIKVFKRNVFVHPFHEENPRGLIDLVGEDNVIFGSDYPHPEGLADPISFVDEIKDLPDDTVQKIMGGNLHRLMNIQPAKVAA